MTKNSASGTLARRKKYKKLLFKKPTECMPRCNTLLIGPRFRWVECQLNALRVCRNVEDVENALTDLPPDLDITYDRILNNVVHENERKRARCILQLITVSVRFLTVEEMNEALIVDCDKENINH